MKIIQLKTITFSSNIFYSIIWKTLARKLQRQLETFIIKIVDFLLLLNNYIHRVFNNICIYLLCVGGWLGSTWHIGLCKFCANVITLKPQSKFKRDSSFEILSNIVHFASKNCNVVNVNIKEKAIDCGYEGIADSVTGIY